MSQERITDQTLDLAVERYKQGKCPCCGKALGESRGLEYRRKSDDLYCHTCKRRWPTEMGAADIRRELSLLDYAEIETPTLPESDPSGPEEAGSPRRISPMDILKRILRRR